MTNRVCVSRHVDGGMPGQTKAVEPGGPREIVAGRVRRNITYPGTGRFVDSAAQIGIAHIAGQYTSVMHKSVAAQHPCISQVWGPGSGRPS